MKYFNNLRRNLFTMKLMIYLTGSLGSFKFDSTFFENGLICVAGRVGESSLLYS